MTDESQLQVRPKGSDSSLTTSKVRSSLITRGRRDAAALAERSSPKPTDAISETRRLAEQGDAEAQSDLAYWYLRGEGVPLDYAEAVKWFSKAAEQGDWDAREMLLFEFPQDYAQAAMKWRREAGEQGHAEAQYILATAYRTGSGVPEDYAEAARWYRRAAEQGHAVAQYSLGAAYFDGEGVPQDHVQAYMWLILAAARGAAVLVNWEEIPASEILSEVAEKAPPAQIAEARRLARTCKPTHRPDK